jgi:hypothetical protein
MAFFQLEVTPACKVRLRRALPRTFSVLTLTTLTLNSSCTACRIWLGREAVGHDGVLIILLGLSRAFFRQADGLDNFESIHVIRWSNGRKLFQTHSS